MLNLSQYTMGRSTEGQKGFTLIELLIVVGIIVALAAVIIPLVIQFADKGDEGTASAELATLQNGIDAMMTENNMPLLANYNENDGGNASLHLDGAEDYTGTGDLLSNYVRDIVRSKCMYWVEDNGVVEQDNAVNGHCPPAS